MKTLSGHLSQRCLDGMVGSPALGRVQGGAISSPHHLLDTGSHWRVTQVRFQKGQEQGLGGWQIQSRQAQESVYDDPSEGVTQEALLYLLSQ